MEMLNNQLHNLINEKILPAESIDIYKQKNLNFANFPPIFPNFSPNSTKNFKNFPDTSV